MLKEHGVELRRFCAVKMIKFVHAANVPQISKDYAQGSPTPIAERQRRRSQVKSGHALAAGGDPVEASGVRASAQRYVRSRGFETGCRAHGERQRRQPNRGLGRRRAVHLAARKKE